MPRFNTLQRLLHWVMGALIVAMLFIGVGMVSTVAPDYVPLLATHKTLGIIILLLVVLRLGTRLVYGAPPLPADMPAPMRLAAQGSHLAFYVLMVAMPLLGWAMLSAGNYPIVLYEGVELPAIVPPSARLHTLLWNAHFYLAFAFFALVLMHFAAALYHGLVRRDGVFTQMAPWRARGPRA